MELSPEDVNIIAHDIDKLRGVVPGLPYRASIALDGQQMFTQGYQGNVEFTISAVGCDLVIYMYIRDAHVPEHIQGLPGYTFPYSGPQFMALVDCRGWITKTHSTMSSDLVIDVFSNVLSQLNQ